MTQKSLVYMVLAVAVGYILVSAVPQQIAMYTNPQEIKLTGSEFSTADGGTITVSPENDTEAIADAAQAAEAAQSAATQAPSLEVRGSGPRGGGGLTTRRLPGTLPGKSTWCRSRQGNHIRSNRCSVPTLAGLLPR